MSARAAETHRSARPAAASKRLRFPGTTMNKLLCCALVVSPWASRRVPGAWGGCCHLVSRPPSGPAGRRLHSLPPRRGLGSGWSRKPLLSYAMLPLGCLFTLQSSCWLYGRQTARETETDSEWERETERETAGERERREQKRENFSFEGFFSL